MHVPNRLSLQEFRGRGGFRGQKRFISEISHRHKYSDPLQQHMKFKKRGKRSGNVGLTQWSAACSVIHVDIN